MAAARQGSPVRLDRAPQRGAAFALTSASRRARKRSLGSRSRGSLLIFDHPPRRRLPRWALNRVAQIAERKYCRSHARPFRLGLTRVVALLPVRPPAAL